MNVTLNIDNEICIKCGKCAKICPSVIFTQEKMGGEITLQNINACIGCGHCVAVCPVSAVIHSEFPEDKVHPIDEIGRAHV